jgi:hypothetical protein
MSVTRKEAISTFGIPHEIRSRYHIIRKLLAERFVKFFATQI